MTRRTKVALVVLVVFVAGVVGFGAVSGDLPPTNQTPVELVPIENGAK